MMDTASLAQFSALDEDFKQRNPNFGVKTQQSVQNGSSEKDKKDMIPQNQIHGKSSTSGRPFSTLPGLWKYPSCRDAIIKSELSWLQGKRVDDGAQSLWRIYDKLYDLTDFVERHPGGSEWLQLTQGTDITEAFEAHHISNLPANVLRSYYVGEASTPRNSPYTFNEDGFFRTMRKRVYEALPKAEMRGPSKRSKAIIDTLVVLALTTAAIAAYIRSFSIAMLAGLLVHMVAGASHNFFHLRPNWRRHYFNLSGLSFRHWAICHVFSHHMYPNSVQDIEISVFEPWLDWLPRSHQQRGWKKAYAVLISPVIYAIFIPLSYFHFLFLISGPQPEDSIFLIPFSTMFLAAGFQDPLTTLALWLTMVMTSSFFFVGGGLNVGHHHPEIFHDGDTPRKDRDWGLAMLDSVRDRTLISGVEGKGSKIDTSRAHKLVHNVLALCNFGHHTMHHLFPAVDHMTLIQLYPILEKTLQEFGEEFVTGSVTEMIQGQFDLLFKDQPNLKPPGEKATSKKVR